MRNFDRLFHFARRLTLLLAFVASTALAAPGTWSSSGPYGGRINQLINFEAGSGTLWANAGGSVFRSTSNGASWQRLAGGLPPSSSISALAASSSAPVLYASSDSQLFRSGNGGTLWVPLGPPTEAGAIIDIAVQRPGADDVAILTEQGVWVSNNGGSTWTGGPLPSDGYYYTIEYAADGALYVGMFSRPSVFGGAALIKSTTLASSWTAINIPDDTFLVSQVAVSPIDPQRLFTIGGGSTHTSADAGLSWNSVTPPANCGSVGAVAPHPGLVVGLFIACGDLGVAATDDVSAPAWTIWGVADGLTVNGIDPVQAYTLQISPNWPSVPNIYVGTRDGGLLRTTNGGTNWSEINHGLEATHIRALATHPVDSGSEAVVLAGYGDAFTSTHPVYKSPDNGVTWNPSHSGLNAEQIRSLVIDPTTVDNDPFTAEDFTVYAAGRSSPIPDNSARDGGLYKSIDGGSTWSTVDNGIAIIFGVPNMGTVRAMVADPRSCATPPLSGPCPAGSGGLQTLFAIGGGLLDNSAPGLPYRSARIYKSTDAGASWSASANGLPLPQDILPGSEVGLASNIGIALAIDPSDTQVMYAGTYLSSDGSMYQPGSDEPTLPNGVFKSTDGGANWIHSSVGLPHYFSATSSQHDVLALAINPTNPQVLYAGVDSFNPTIGFTGTIYKSTDAGATWFESSTGIAGADVRALLIDPNDPSGDTIYAGTAGTGANPGGVFRSTDAGATWNSYSIGLPAFATTALAMPARATGDPVRLLAGTNAGVWEFTEVPDEDADGSPSAVENNIVAGDGNADGVADAGQTNVASVETPASASFAQRGGTQSSSTIEIVAGSACAQLNDSYGQAANLFPQDPLGDGSSHAQWGLVHVALPACSASKLRVTFHGASFDSSWTWRNYGPRIPGDETSFGWYSFAGAQRIDADTWELDLDALRQGNYRNDPNDILFIGGPGLLPDLIFGNSFQ